MKKYITVFLLAIFWSTQAGADEPKKLHTFGDWDVYIQDMGDGVHICHAIAYPYRSKVFHGLRNSPFTSVTFQDGTYTLSIYPGFTMDPNMPPVVIVEDDKTIPLKVVRETYALTHSDMVDLSFFNRGLARHGNFTVHSYSSHDRSAMDVYSLDGLIQANRYMQQHCR